MKKRRLNEVETKEMMQYLLEKRGVILASDISDYIRGLHDHPFWKSMDVLMKNEDKLTRLEFLEQRYDIYDSFCPVKRWRELEPCKVWIGELEILQAGEQVQIVEVPRSTVPTLEIPCTFCGHVKNMSLDEINVNKRKKKYRCVKCNKYFPINDPKQWKIIEELLAK